MLTQQIYDSEQNNGSPRLVVNHSNSLKIENVELEDQQHLKMILTVLSVEEPRLETRDERRAYGKIENKVKTFNRAFDNTVVDTYAFERALETPELTNAIYYYYNNEASKYFNNEGINESKSALDDQIQEAVNTYILYQVKKIYKKTGRKISQPAVYQEYVARLFERLVAGQR